MPQDVGLTPAVFEQRDYQVRFEWGREGVRRLAPLSDVVIVVDVLSFTTCVEVAVSRDAVVFPYRYKDAPSITFASEVRAVLAGERGTIPSLSPSSLMELGPNSRIVLPSQNGSECTVAASEACASVIAGCLRNAAAVARHVKRITVAGQIVSVIACGEHWTDNSLRPAMEDCLGAGAILSHFDEATLSPEAQSAVAVFRRFQDEMLHTLRACSSGRELIAKGFPNDVSLASELSVSRTVPVLVDGAYIKATT